MEQYSPYFLLYYYHPLKVEEGRNAVDRAVTTAAYLNPPDDMKQKNGALESNWNLGLTAEKMINGGHFDGLMTLFPPAKHGDKRTHEAEPFALQLYKSPKPMKTEPITGKLFLDGYFAEQKNWMEKPVEEFWGNLDLRRVTTGYACYTTKQDVTVRFNLVSKDGLSDIAMRKNDDTGLYHPYYPRADNPDKAAEFRVNMVLEPLPLTNTSPHLRMN